MTSGRRFATPVSSAAVSGGQGHHLVPRWFVGARRAGPPPRPPVVCRRSPGGATTASPGWSVGARRAGPPPRPPRVCGPGARSLADGACVPVGLRPGLNDVGSALRDSGFECGPLRRAGPPPRPPVVCRRSPGGATTSAPRVDWQGRRDRPPPRPPGWSPPVSPDCLTVSVREVGPGPARQRPRAARGVGFLCSASASEPTPGRVPPQAVSELAARGRCAGGRCFLSPLAVLFFRWCGGRPDHRRRFTLGLLVFCLF